MKRISKITLILMAAASMTACGKVGERSSLPIPQQPATAVTESATETAAEELTTVADTTTSAAAEGSETVTTTSTEADASAVSTTENTAAAPVQQQNAQSQVSAASADSNYGPAPVQYDIPGLTYINGVLIANKSYSLPADFNPGLDSTCYNQFCKLSSAAAQEGLNIYLSSGFRSYDYQAQIYNNYVERETINNNGDAVKGKQIADTYSARPGHSEHQTGLAIDVNQIDDSFIGTREAIWLENHCHEFGFILRYPQGKQDITGYQYESWHIRYLGTDLATQIHNSGLTLEEYFGIDSYYH